MAITDSLLNIETKKKLSQSYKSHNVISSMPYFNVNLRNISSLLLDQDVPDAIMAQYNHSAAHDL